MFCTSYTFCTSYRFCTSYILLRLKHFTFTFICMLYCCMLHCFACYNCYMLFLYMLLFFACNTTLFLHATCFTGCILFMVQCFMSHFQKSYIFLHAAIFSHVQFKSCCMFHIFTFFTSFPFSYIFSTFFHQTSYNLNLTPCISLFQFINLICVHVYILHVYTSYVLHHTCLHFFIQFALFTLLHFYVFALIHFSHT